MRIFLTGFMGCGKTTVGRCLAERLGVPFLDLDDEIERVAGITVREIFARHGEEVFRRLEREALARTLEHPDVVVATGGGTLTFEANQAALRRAGVTVWLNPPFDELISRIGALGKQNRPLFRDETQALALYRARLPAYRRADVRVDVDRAEPPEAVAGRIALLIGAGRCVT